MKIKHKIGFVALVSLVDIFVIILVVISNGKTNIENDVSSKTSAHILKNEEITEIETENATDNEEKIEEIEEEIEEIVEVEEPVITEEIYPVYDYLSFEEKVEALNSGTLHLEYSNVYTNSSDRLTQSRGAIADYNGHRETYYSERVLPGTGLNIPGRHVADDGTVRDEEGYICVAANYEFMPKGSILITSLGPAKVYDTGCAYGTIDIYVNW